MRITGARDWPREPRLQNAIRKFDLVMKLSSFDCFCCSLTDDKLSATSEKDRILQEKEAELKRMQEMIAQLQAKMQTQAL